MTRLMPDQLKKGRIYVIDREWLGVLPGDHGLPKWSALIHKPAAEDGALHGFDSNVGHVLLRDDQLTFAPMASMPQDRTGYGDGPELGPDGRPNPSQLVRNFEREGPLYVLDQRHFIFVHEGKKIVCDTRYGLEPPMGALYVGSLLPLSGFRFLGEVFGSNSWPDGMAIELGHGGMMCRFTGIRCLFNVD